jgi:multimeric flavodoxin WrbA
MKAIIIVHSQTGTTLKLAQAIRDKLAQAGMEAELCHLQTTEQIKGGTHNTRHNIKFTNLPDVSACDAVLIGAPVWAFNASVVIAQAFELLGPQLRGKTVVPFATMGFPLAWMGGNRTLRWMRARAATLGAKVLPGGVVTGARKGKDERIEALANMIKGHLL